MVIELLVGKAEAVVIIQLDDIRLDNRAYLRIRIKGKNEPEFFVRVNAHGSCFSPNLQR
jgi:hypothetical protein